MVNGFGRARDDAASGRGRPRRRRWWHVLLGIVGAALALEVLSSASARPPGPDAPSGVPMPVADLPGWRLVLADDFTTDVAPGAFPGPAYADRWTAYDGFTDTSGLGVYSAAAISVRDGMLELDLRTVAGQPVSAAPVPLLDGTWGGSRYARVSVRFRADPVPGYKAAWLLWPDSDDWDEGEINFPEGHLDGTFWAFNHCLGDPVRLCFARDTHTRFDAWHTATIEWLPEGVTFLLDGRVVGRSDVSPTTPMHWVLQTETVEGGPGPQDSGRVQIDWVTIHVPGRDLRDGAWTGLGTPHLADLDAGRPARGSRSDQEKDE